MDRKYEGMTIRQLDLMKHALGLDQVGAKPKRGKYTAYRNYFCTYGKDEDWEILVELGLAIYRTRETSVYYHVSKDGISLMESVMGFKIVEGE